MAIKFTNNASSTLASSINSTTTTITLAAAGGALFPSLGAGDYFYATLVDSSNNLEIVRVDARAGDVLTVVRGQDGTTAQSFVGGDKFELRPVAAALLAIADESVSITGDTMTGALTLPGLNDSGNLTFTGTGNRITGDFSNATVANRVMFQTSTTDGNSLFDVIPNGTGTATWLAAVNNSTPTNAGVTQIVATSSESQVRADRYGSGTYLPMTFYTGGSERMRVDTSGNVGIGTTSPTSFSATSKTLQVSSANTGYGTVLVDSNGTALGQFYATTDGSPFVMAGSRSNHPFLFSVNNTERMRIDSSGNVGIGTGSPVVALEVSKGNNTEIRVVDDPATSRGGYIRATGSAVQMGTTSSVRPLELAVDFVTRGRFDANNNFQFNSGFGSVATAYGCRAWANWSGTGSVIRASGNVTSISSAGSGQYTVNFTNPMPDANYAVAGTANSTAYAATSSYLVVALGVWSGSNFVSTTSCRVISGNNDAESFLNATWITASFFR